MNRRLSTMNYELLTRNRLNPLYHYRTLAVTEAYALIDYFRFKILKNSDLICGISFYKQ
jgi:hypothetical protein